MFTPRRPFLSPSIQRNTLYQNTLQHRGTPVTPQSFELDEWIHCTVKIRNRSSKTLSIPNITHNLGKQTLEGLRHWLAQGVVRISVKRDGKPVEMVGEWKRTSVRASFPLSTKLRAGDTVKVHFPLSWPYSPKFFSIDQSGTYTVAIAIDTTKTDDAHLWKGRISASSTFVVTEVPTFRPKQATQSDAEYANARIDFYLTRIAGGKGRYAGNVVEILKTPEGIPALISMLGSEDKAGLQQVEYILQRIHSRLDGRQDRAHVPHSRDGWMRWWNSAGSKMSFAELWGNFDSHWQ